MTAQQAHIVAIVSDGWTFVRTLDDEETESDLGVQGAAIVKLMQISAGWDRIQPAIIAYCQTMNELRNRDTAAYYLDWMEKTATAHGY